MSYETEFERDLLSGLQKRGFYHSSRMKPLGGGNVRGYTGAKVDRLTDDWNINQASADTDIKSALPRIRSRSRDLEQNNDYVNRYLNMNEGNVIGPAGIRMQSKARGTDGKLDRDTALVVQDSFQEWGKLGNCTVDGMFSWVGLQRLISRTVPRDGEVVIRIVRNFDNGFRFALQVLEADYLNLNLDNVLLPSGNRIRMGVEFNEWKRPVAYWILSAHPGDTSYSATSVLRNSTRVPAEDIIHLFVPVRPGQTRGIPWLHTAMLRLKMIGAYEEAEVVASRMAASKVWVYEREEGGAYAGDGEDSQGGIEEHIEPGMAVQPPSGVKMSLLDPTHPNSNYDEFIKAALRGIASGLNVSYVSLGNDLKGVNFSSIRQGVLDERTGWRMVQQFYIEYFHQRVFDAWLPWALMTDMRDMSFSDRRLISHVKWQPRGWDWVDPAKDVKANTEAITARLKSRTEIITERGRDPEEVWAELENEEAVLKDKGLIMDAPVIPPEPPEENDDPAAGGKDDEI